MSFLAISRKISTRSDNHRMLVCQRFLTAKGRAIIYFHRGSAFPATLAFQLRELERKTDGDLKLDALITVIDAENFIGYEDTSPTARMQASYTDIIVIVRASF